MTWGDDVLVVLPATLPLEELKRRLALADAAVIMKIGRHLPKVRSVLERLDLWDKARIIERVGLPGQRIFTPEEVEALPYFSVILVHRRGQAWL